MSRSHSFMFGPVRKTIEYPFLPFERLACGSCVLHHGVHLSMKALNWPGTSAQYEGDTHITISAFSNSLINKSKSSCWMHSAVEWQVLQPLQKLNL